MKNVPMSAEINYLAESQFDEEVIIKTSAEKTEWFGFQPFGFQNQ